MKTINEIISEKLKISKTTNNYIHKYFPKDREELIECIVNHLKENNGDLRDIDTSKVDNFNGLFRRLAHPPIRDIVEINVSGWNTSNVTTMARMFFGCFKLEKIKGIEDWDISNVESMRSMFYNCPRLCLDLTSWDINNTCETSNMTHEAKHIKLNIK